MAEPFLGEIRLMSFSFPPMGWAHCDGQLLSIAQNQALFSLLGTTFGGDGRTTFALPDLRGRVPIHTGSGHSLGERGGEQAHTLSLAELPAHSHPLNGTSSSVEPNGVAVPDGNLLAATSSPIYADPAGLVSMAPGMVTSAGGSQAHLNMQPFLTLNFCIALEGIFPSVN